VTKLASHQVRPLIDGLKRALRHAGLTYAQLAPHLQLSEASIKRLFSQGRFSLEQLLRVCEVLGIDLAELARNSRSRAEAVRELESRQERALADHPPLLVLFHLLMAGWTVPDIAHEYQLRGTECTQLLAQLDRLKLIELLPNDRVKLRVAPDFSWRSDGPIRRRYGAQVMGEFLQDRFRGELALLRFEVRELSEASITLLRRKLERLAHEVAEFADLDASLPSARKRSVGVAVAIRPWTFSLERALKKPATSGD
jgi:Cro/C1-type HTH DNA-binding domain